MSALDKLSEFRRRKVELGIREMLGTDRTFQERLAKARKKERVAKSKEKRVAGRTQKFKAISANKEQQIQERTEHLRRKAFMKRQAEFPKRKIRVTKTKTGQTLITNL